MIRIITMQLLDNMPWRRDDWGCRYQTVDSISPPSDVRRTPACVEWRSVAHRSSVWKLHRTRDVLCRQCEQEALWVRIGWTRRHPTNSRNVDIGEIHVLAWTRSEAWPSPRLALVTTASPAVLHITPANF